MCRKQEISIDNHRHKNSRNARKTAIPADAQIAPRGFEPLEEKSQSTIKQALTKTPKSVFATGFAKMMQESVIFRQIIRDVMKMSAEQKEALVRILQEVDDEIEKAVADISDESETVGV